MKPNKKLKSKKIVDDVLRVHNIKANIKKTWWESNSNMNSGGCSPIISRKL